MSTRKLTWRERRWVEARAAVMWTLLAAPESRHYGYETSRASGMGPGRMYPVLTSLLASGVVRDGWDDTCPRPRRFYVLTDLGKQEAPTPTAERLPEPEPAEAAAERTIL